MRAVNLGDSGLVTSILGYGCAGLARPDTDAERQALLHAAFDAGIRHFDIARYYGHGEAEAVLGKFLSEGNRRDQVTVTSKFGLEPSPIGNSSGGRSVMGFARRLASIHPAVRKVFSGFAQRTVRTNRFDPDSARRSLEQSLRELKTDRLDLLLLHEATLADTQTTGLIEFLEGAKQEGKIRAYGLGTEVRNVPDILDHAPRFARTMQIVNCLGQWNLDRWPPGPDRTVNTHGALKILPALETALASSGEQSWSVLRGPALAGHLLGLTMHFNPGGMTLFSSIQPDRIRENVRHALQSEAANDAAAWADFKRVGERALASTSPDVHSL